MPEGYLKWWSIHEAEYPRLAQLARDVFGIPGISAEVERHFSSAKLILPPHRSNLEPVSIEAGECIRSWVVRACSWVTILIIYHLMLGSKSILGFRLGHHFASLFIEIQFLGTHFTRVSVKSDWVRPGIDPNYIG
jgi:hypothetical protein